MHVVLLLLLSCGTSGGEPPDAPETAPAPVPAPEPAPAGAALSKPLHVELVLNRPVDLPSLGATVTLTEAKTALVRDPATGRRHHTDSGTLRFTEGDHHEDIAFGTGAGPLTWRGYLLTVRGTDGWYELIIRPAP